MAKLARIRTRFLRPFILGLPLLFVAAVGYYFFFGQGAINSLVTQTQFRQLILARSGRSSLESFLKTIHGSLLILASQIDTPEETQLDQLQKSLDTYVDVWAGTPTAEVIFFDSQGILRAVSHYPQYQAQEPLDINDREYVIWAKTAQKGETYAGMPIKPRTGAFQDQYVIPYTTPVFAEDGTRLGGITMGIALSDLATTFVQPLKLTPQSRVYLIDSRGLILYSPFPELQGIDYISYLKNQSFPGASLIAGFLLKTAASTDEGTFQVVLPNVETRSLSTMLVAHVPIFYDSTDHWTLAMATPLDASLSFIVPLYLNQIGLLIASILIVLVYVVYLAKKLAYRQAVRELTPRP